MGALLGQGALDALDAAATAAEAEKAPSAASAARWALEEKIIDTRRDVDERNVLWKGKDSGRKRRANTHPAAAAAAAAATRNKDFIKERP